MVQKPNAMEKGIVEELVDGFYKRVPRSSWHLAVYLSCMPLDYRMAEASLMGLDTIKNTHNPSIGFSFSNKDLHNVIGSELVEEGDGNPVYLFKPCIRQTLLTYLPVPSALSVFAFTALALNLGMPVNDNDFVQPENLQRLGKAAKTPMQLHYMDILKGYGYRTRLAQLFYNAFGSYDSGDFGRADMSYYVQK